jgi:hypothetical protein
MSGVSRPRGNPLPPIFENEQDMLEWSFEYTNTVT